MPVAGAGAARDTGDMVARLPLVALFLMSSCTQFERTLPPCWTNNAYTDGQPVTGRVSILVDETVPHRGSDGSAMVSVSPLTCENGSFLVLDPPARLVALAQPARDDRPIFGSAFEADIDGTVRLIPHQGHLGYVRGFSIEIRAIRDLRRVPRPRWWRWTSS